MRSFYVNISLRVKISNLFYSISPFHIVDLVSSFWSLVWKEIVHKTLRCFFAFSLYGTPKKLNYQSKKCSLYLHQKSIQNLVWWRFFKFMILAIFKLKSINLFHTQKFVSEYLALVFVQDLVVLLATWACEKFPIKQVLTSKGTCYKETVSDQIKKGRVTPCFALVFRQSKCTFFRLQAMSLEQYFCQD